MSNISIKQYFTILLSLFMLSAISLFFIASPAGAQSQERDQRYGRQTPAKSATRQAPARMVTPRQVPSRITPAQYRPRMDTSQQAPMRAGSTRMAPSGPSGGSQAPSGHFVDSRYQHNRSYPTRGQSFRSLPLDRRVVMHDHTRYYSSHGTWYRRHGGSFVVVAPPIGLFVPFLPLFYSTIWFGGMPYYYANDTYYTQTPGGYVVIDPPRDGISETPPEAAESMEEDKMFIYPRKGQSDEQQAKDRYECHKWAMEQTNYDPTEIPSPVPSDQLPQVRNDYRRAFAACLDGRGYTVR